jgi:Gliding motility associated protein GldN
MKIIHILCTLLIIWVLIANQSKAQNQPISREALLANPDILWVAETQAFVQLDSLPHIDCAQPKNVYKEDNPDMIAVRDTAQNCAYQYKINLLVYYNHREHAFGSFVMAISPVVKTYDDNGNFLHIKPVCWFKTAPAVSDFTKKTHFYTQYDCSFKNLQALKSTQTLTECLDMQLICAEEEAEKMLTFGHPQDSNHLNPKALRERLSIRDTILSIDKHPEYGDAYIWTVYVSTRLNPTEIPKISFLMQWAWDADTQQIYCKNLLYAPILKHPRKPNFYAGEESADTATYQPERPLFWKTTAP